MKKYSTIINSLAARLFSTARRPLFFMMLAAPSLFLLGIAAYFFYELHQVNNIDYGVILHRLREHLARKEPISFPLPDDIFVRDARKKTVFVFGESSLVISDGSTFPDYLEQDHPELQVVNFGINGIDSFSIRQRVAEALSVARPDAIVLYYGHNDYNNAYQGYILPTFFNRFNSLARITHFFHDRDKPQGVILHDTYEWYSRLKRPLFFELFERLNLIGIERSKFERVDQVILDNYIRNNEAIIDMAEAQRIPVVLITPVGNLQAKPYGDLHVTAQHYYSGKTISDYHESKCRLTMAKDAEFLTYSIRAKSELLDYIRDFEHPFVYVLDLDEKLEEMHFGFGYADFLDYFHFNDKTHELISDIIYEFMTDKNILKKNGK